MTSLTGTQIKTKIQYDCDAFDDTWIDLDTELLGYINESIDDCEALIHGLYESYFKVRSTISLVSGTSSYAYPSDIYAMKVLGLYYNDGGTKRYEIKRFKDEKEIMYYTDSSLPYKWDPTNDSSSGARINLYPTPLETNSNVKIIYIRNAKRLTAYSDTCDIPEFQNYLFAHVKWNLAKKDRSPLDLATQEKHLMAMKELLEGTLSSMVPDEGNEIRPDFSFYQDFDSLENF